MNSANSNQPAPMTRPVARFVAPAAIALLFVFAAIAFVAHAADTAGQQGSAARAEGRSAHVARSAGHRGSAARAKERSEAREAMQARAHGPAARNQRAGSAARARERSQANAQRVTPTSGEHRKSHSRGRR